MLAELGVAEGERVLIAARSVEATEVSAFCASLRAETFVIDDGHDGSAVAIALSVRPRLFVYDTSIIPSPTVLAIGSALSRNGCQCAMLAVAEKADPNHGHLRPPTPFLLVPLAACVVSVHSFPAASCMLTPYVASLY
jgi:hypothetical protein